MWRPFNDDITVIQQLDAAVKHVDGDEPVSNLIGDVTNADETLSGWTDDGQLVALGWGKRVNAETMLVGGRVHPDFRRRGCGGHLLDWALERGQGIQTLVIRNESLTNDTHRLYTHYGFRQTFAENMLVYDLSQPVASCAVPEGLGLIRWTVESAPLFFEAYTAAFRERPGFVEVEAAEWITEYEDDEDFCADLSVVVMDGTTPVGFVTCGTLGGLAWVSQIGTSAAGRGRRLAHALLSHVLTAFEKEGMFEAGLHVNINNPKGLHVFESFGFKQRLRRARYVKQNI